jgi:hypothetical protein
MKIITKHYAAQAATTVGGEVDDDIFGVSLCGKLQQVIVTLDSGAATTIDIELRYETGNSDMDMLVYQNTGASLPVTDSDINAPFTLLDPNLASSLILYLKTNSNSTFNVRLDFEV